MSNVPFFIADCLLSLKNLSWCTLLQIERVLKDGIDLRGVFYWTLTDNWEWAQGWGEKFGLYR